MAPQAQRLVYAAGEWEVDLARRELRASGVAVPIGGRAFEIIEVLVQSAGVLVTKDALIASVWPGAIVEENTLQVHISAVRKAFGSDRAMLKTASGRGYRLQGAWTARQVVAPGSPVAASGSPLADTPARTPSQPVRTNLVAATSDLLGRAMAVRQVQDLLSAYRAVTLTGPGGIGKTSLALEVARSLVANDQGEGWVVELAALSDPSLVAPSVAAVLGLALGAGKGDPESVARAIGGRRLLLVLDNCEHVIDAACQLAETVLHLCPRTTILVTSREVLRIDGECVYRVPPLEVPSPGDANDARESSAVQLFIARAKALDADFSRADDTLAAIAAICRRLDGIPLAIEFAAARAAVLGVHHVAANLDDRFGLLTDGRRTSLPRHRTLRATLDWSYELLPEPEQRLLRHLAIFPAGFGLEAAAAVFGDANDARSAVAEGIANLLSKSLVTLDGSAPGGRWRLLETTRAYALEKLAAGGEVGMAARRHAEYCRDLVAPSAIGGQRTPSAESIGRFVGDLDNIRAALDWAFSRDGDAAIGVVLTAECAPMWLHLSLLVECRDRALRALDNLRPELNLGAQLVLQLHVALGVALFLTTGSAETCAVVFGKALQIAETLDDVESQMRALWGMFAYRINNGEPRLALPLAERFSQLASRGGDPADMLVADRLTGFALHYAGNQPRARHHIQRVVEAYVAPSGYRHSMWFLYDQRVLARSILARVLWLQGFADQAMRQVRAGLDQARAAAHAPSLCYALGCAAYPVALRTGDLASAERFVATLIDVATRNESAFWTKLGPCLEGALLIRRGEIARGLELLLAAYDLSHRTGLALHFSGFHGDLAEALAAVGRTAEALTLIEQAIERYAGTGLEWCMPELLRVKGEVLLQSAPIASASASEACFQRAQQMAQQQGALFWELRAALSLARLRLGRHRLDDARETLAAVYRQFTEGFETTDLAAAKALLDNFQDGRGDAPPLWA